MQTMTSNELTAFLNNDSTARIETRTLANIARRAQTLFQDGYTVDTCRVNGLYFITGPQGQEYVVDFGTALGNHCDCPAFDKYATCKHFQAVDLMQRDEAQAAEYDAQDAYDPYELAFA